MAPTIKLIYFSLPGRAEVSRLIAAIGKLEIEDTRLTFDAWKSPDNSVKAVTPFGQVPVLEVDGKFLAQSPAIDRYLASLAGLLPADPWRVALADQAYAFMEDVMQTIYPTFKIADADDKIKARQEIVAGALADKLALLTKLVEGRPGTYLTGDTITHGDLAVFCSLSTLQSGWLDGALWHCSLCNVAVVWCWLWVKRFMHTHPHTHARVQKKQRPRREGRRGGLLGNCCTLFRHHRKHHCAAALLATPTNAGVPTDLLKDYPTLKAFRNHIASVPEVAAFYAKEKDDIRTTGFKADA